MTQDLTPQYTVPGLGRGATGRLTGMLRLRLHAAGDLHPALEHVRRNVVGPHFIGWPSTG
ncbi:hypothetical protein ACL02U_04050 [Streptomyces sp. MS06]|uniref:hypothetical protein n=1 Tax=Streptomyces sp. MS06 TaxID=3385974 RepID=UPI0039A3397B